MNKYYEKTLRIYENGLRNICRFSNLGIKRLTIGINEGDTNLLEYDDYISKLEDNRDFWLLVKKTLEVKIQNAN